MKNVEKYIIVILSVIAVVAIGTSVYFGIKYDKDNNNKIYGIIDNNSYTLEMIKIRYGRDFIRKINDDEIIIFNGETTYSCKYNKPCDIWPDSDNGSIMWAAPLVTITFKKGNKESFEPVNETKNVILQVLKYDIKLNIETIEKNINVDINHEINLENYNGNNIKILGINEENVKILRSALRYEKFDSGRVIKYLEPVEEIINYDSVFTINIDSNNPDGPFPAQARYQYKLKFINELYENNEILFEKKYYYSMGSESVIIYTNGDVLVDREVENPNHKPDFQKLKVLTKEEIDALEIKLKSNVSDYEMQKYINKLIHNDENYDLIKK